MNIRIGVVSRGNGLRGIVLAGLFACYLPMVTLAATTNDISLGSVTIAVDGEYVLTGSSTGNTVAVSGGVTANITLQNLSIDVNLKSGTGAFSIASNALVNLTLLGSNTLASGMGCAGLRVPEGANLTIVANGTGSLSASGRYGAGIGGNLGESCGIVHLGSNAVVTALGHVGGAGIGGGPGGAGGNVQILGGTVTAIGGQYAAGIGGGDGGNGGTVIITSGSVKATGDANNGAENIGSGSGGGSGTLNNGASSGNVGVYCVTLPRVSSVSFTVTNSVEYTYSYEGHGHSGDTNLYFYLPNGNYVFDMGNFSYAATVDGTATQAEIMPVGVTVDGTDIMAGSGDGWNFSRTTGFLALDSSGAYVLAGSSTIVRIVVPSDVTNTITLDSLDVNVGHIVDACVLSIASNATVNLILLGSNTLMSGQNCAGLQVPEGAALVITTNSSGRLSAQGGAYGAGIGGGFEGAAGTITIAGGTIAATGGENFGTDFGGGAGIGGGGGEFCGAGGTITISGGTVTATGGANAAGVGSSGTSYVGGAGAGGTIRISGGTVTAYGGHNGAGIGVGYGGREGNIAISGGTMTATGSGVGAGIGGWWNSEDGTITISGGTVTATGGGEGAGIGGGQGCSGGSITISGGLVTTTGGEEGGAGIGGGGGEIFCGAGGTITISGGTVTASGGGGAGIGGGWGAAGGTITISGGTVTARGADSGAAGIGGGGEGAGGAITISGGTVTAIGGDYLGDEGGAGIGGGYQGAGGTVEIMGGSVNATGGFWTEDIGGSLTDGKGIPVYKVTIPGVADGVNLTTIFVPLAGGGSYDYSGFGHPSDTNLYFYLPNGIYEFDVVVSEIGSAGYAARVKNMATMASLADSFPPYIASVESDVSSLVFDIIPSNTVFEILGATTVLENGDWDWNPVDYTREPNGSIRIATSNSLQIIRVKFLPH